MIEAKGAHKRLVGMISAWDVLEKLDSNMAAKIDDGWLKIGQQERHAGENPHQDQNSDLK